MWHWEYVEKNMTPNTHDFAGMFMDLMRLIVMDTFSKWFEIVKMTLTFTTTTFLNNELFLPNGTYHKYCMQK